MQISIISYTIQWYGRGVVDPYLRADRFFHYSPRWNAGGKQAYDMAIFRSLCLAYRGQRYVLKEGVTSATPTPVKYLFAANEKKGHNLDK